MHTTWEHNSLTFTNHLRRILNTNKKSSDTPGNMGVPRWELPSHPPAPNARLPESYPGIRHTSHSPYYIATVTHQVWNSRNTPNPKFLDSSQKKAVSLPEDGPSPALLSPFYTRLGKTGGCQPLAERIVAITAIYSEDSIVDTCQKKKYFKRIRITRTESEQTG